MLDAGCGQGHFARFYRQEYPGAVYVGDRHLRARRRASARRSIEDAEFHVADLCRWDDPAARTFDVVQSLEVLHLILDDAVVTRALAALAGRLKPRGALLVTAALPDTTVQPGDYLRYRSRSFWASAMTTLGLRIVAERPMYYWLPSGGPAQQVPALRDDAAGPARAVRRRSRGAGPRRAEAAIGRHRLPHAAADDSADMTLRIGIIGFGGSGQAHAFYWSCVAGCRVTKVFDPKPRGRRARRVARARRPVLRGRGALLARSRRGGRVHARRDARQATSSRRSNAACTCSSRSR